LAIRAKDDTEEKDEENRDFHFGCKLLEYRPAVVRRPLK